MNTILAVLITTLPIHLLAFMAIHAERKKQERMLRFALLKLSRKY